MSIVNCNQMAAITNQWWRRLVNAYEMKAGIVCLQCKNCVIHTWSLNSDAWVSYDGALYKSLYLYHCLSSRIIIIIIIIRLITH